jgi:GTP cyclohydrolase I
MGLADCWQTMLAGMLPDAVMPVNVRVVAEGVTTGLTTAGRLLDDAATVCMTIGGRFDTDRNTTGRIVLDPIVLAVGIRCTTG